MANEFIARKGIISLDSIQVSGSIIATGGITVSGSISSASFATTAATASSADNFFVRQNLTASSALFTGSITAQTLVVQTVTSSIVYSSGSNIFGNLPSNVQQFTGSLRVTGSGNHFIQGGCVGIGCATPGYILDVSGSVHTSNEFILDNNRYIRFQRSSGGSYIQTLGIPSGTDDVRLLTSGDFNIVNGSLTNLMTVKNGGSVGIGTCSPNAALTIQRCTNSGGGSTFPRLEVENILPTQGDGSTTFNFSDVRIASGNSCVQMFLATSYAAGTWEPQGLINVSTNTPLIIRTCNTERMRITSGGNVGIGVDPTGNSNRILHVNGADSAELHLTRSNSGTSSSFGGYITFDGSNNFNIQNRTGGDIIFTTTTSERMRITSGGNVGIGTTDNTAAYRLNVAVNGGSAYIGVTNQSGAAGDRYLRIGFGTGATVASIQGTRVNVADDVNLALQPDGGNVGIGTISPQLNTNSGKFLTVQSSVGSGWLELATSTTTDGLGGALSFNNTNRTGTDKRIAQIAGVKDGANDTGALSFVTWNAGTGVERMRISCNGAVYINSSSNQLANATPALGILAGTTCDAINIKHVQNGNNSVNIWQTGTSAFGAIVFYKGNTQDERGNITVSTTGTSFNSVSDYRLKENVTLSSCGLDRLMQLKPSKFNWIQTGEEAEGFIAHELQEVFPYAVTGEKDGVYSSTGNIKPQSVDYGRITPLLVKAIQEQQCQICTQSIIIDQLKTCLGII